MLEYLKIAMRNPWGVPLPDFVRAYMRAQGIPRTERDYKREYMRAYRFIRRNPELFHVEKVEGILNIAPTSRTIDLIKAGAKFKNCKNSIYRLPQSAKPQRIDAVKCTLMCQMATPTIKEQIEGYFQDYISFINRSWLFFKEHNADIEESPIYALPYFTRFNDERRLAAALAGMETAFSRANSMFKVGVFLTLTTDPKRFKSLWHANRHMMKAWNRFMSRIQYLIGFRPKYICAAEYTKETMLCHLHILIFGISGITSHEKITEIWEDCGQGSINWEYTIVRRGNSWQWWNKPPDFAEGQSPEQYLKKYLKKAFYDDTEIIPFWVFNKRFWTGSRIFTESYQEPRTVFCNWDFIGAYSEDRIPYFLLEAAIFELDKPPPDDWRYRPVNARLHTP